MSQLKVNSIVPVGGLPSGAAAGGIIQTVVGTHSTQVSQSYSSEGSIQTTITDTGLTASITPSSNASKVLVVVHQYYGFDSDNDLQNQYNFVVRDSSNNILDGDIGTGTEGTNRYKSLKAWYDFYHTVFVHSPSTTSSFTYKVGMNAYRQFGGTTTMYAQRHGKKSTITLMELTG
tara:strand:+ start:123 stop:647 length:525 start_codon:yes stop_codon:yes gene_type:complete